MPKIINEYVDEWTCVHYFEVQCCDPFTVTSMGYAVDWHEMESQSPDELLRNYKCPHCKAMLTEEQVLERLKTPRQIEVRVHTEHYNNALHGTAPARGDFS